MNLAQLDTFNPNSVNSGKFSLFVVVNSERENELTFLLSQACGYWLGL